MKSKTKNRPSTSFVESVKDVVKTALIVSPVVLFGYIVMMATTESAPATSNNKANESVSASPLAKQLVPYDLTLIKGVKSGFSAVARDNNEQMECFFTAQSGVEFLVCDGYVREKTTTK
jgi:hypothetical protein